MNKLYEGYSGLSPEKQSDLLARVGCNGCHDMVGLFDRACSMLQEFSTDMEEGEYFVTGTVKSVSEDGYRDYLQIDYGSADIDKVPEEGKYATVYYHDEAYGDTTNVDESGFATAAYGVSSADMSMQAEADDDDVDGTVDEPGYKALGEDYGKHGCYHLEHHRYRQQIELRREHRSSSPSSNGSTGFSRSPNPVFWSKSRAYIEGTSRLVVTASYASRHGRTGAVGADVRRRPQDTARMQPRW